MTAPLTIKHIRKRALGASMSGPTMLGDAVASLGFVQADPIRAPARAQDLILRHRVVDYRVGDLDQHYAPLGMEEDFLYAHGFMPRDTANLLHPRHDPEGPKGRHRPAGIAKKILAFVREHGPTHPQDLERRFGNATVVNGWGGMSKATTQALQKLHYYGFLRVAGRRNGIRVYEIAGERPEALSPEERTRRLVRVVTRVLSPISTTSLRATCALLSHGAPGAVDAGKTVQAMLKSGELEKHDVDGETYLWPSDMGAAAGPGDAALGVKFLAPFDPIVWDRRRFEHLWGWRYRFEAYTPAAKRKFGYYALPLLWNDRIIGWANLALSDGRLRAQFGFAGPAPKSRAFRRALEAEIARMETFLVARD